jgi:hypothetical protein
MDEEWGSRPGVVEQNRGPHLTSVRLIPRSERCTAYRFPPAAARGDATKFPLYGVPIPTRRRPLGRPRISRRPLLPHRRCLPAGHGLKNSATPPHPSHVRSALVSTERAAPQGNERCEEWKFLLRFIFVVFVPHS